MSDGAYARRLKTTSNWTTSHQRQNFQRYRVLGPWIPLLVWTYGNIWIQPERLIKLIGFSRNSSGIKAISESAVKLPLQLVGKFDTPDRRRYL